MVKAVGSVVVKAADGVEELLQMLLQLLQTPHQYIRWYNRAISRNNFVESTPL